jgi:hypothetical protein
LEINESTNSALGRLRQEDYVFKASLGNTVKTLYKKEKNEEM